MSREATRGPQLDLTMPARHRWCGGKHPVTLVIDEIVGIFRELGFTVALGPETESEWYNFGALNFPADHPAMDLHDTLYVGDGALLRTHTSPVQVRTLQRHAPPIRILAPGTVFRRDPFDASHAPAFAQIEGLAVDEGISFVDLKSTLTHFAQRFFGATRTRFRPSFFPFTEPSAEMDVECRLCAGRGCSACKGTGWMEILGSGMVHPAVLEAAGIDSERYTGWAFGMGPGRIAMQRYDLPDIRILYDSDVRFLEQVAE
jgi:phenylalanyl-tRNA synthetase alpha chain